MSTFETIKETYLTEGIATGGVNRLDISADGNTITLEDAPAWVTALGIDAAGTAVAMAIALGG